MAFRQPQQRPQSRHTASSVPLAVDSPSESTHIAAQRKRPLEDTEEWVLFSPSPALSSSHTHTTLTRRQSRSSAVRPLSLFSDFASLETDAAASGSAVSVELGEEIPSPSHICDTFNDVPARVRGFAVNEPSAAQINDIDEDGDLDSLDEGLRAFHEPSDFHHGSSPPLMDHSGGTVLPAHDGMGSFVPNTALAQEQHWQFEHPASRRRQHHHRRLSSVQRTLDALDQQDQEEAVAEKHRRIDQWRLEQSKSLLHEIEKEAQRQLRLSSSKKSLAVLKAGVSTAEIDWTTGLPRAVSARSLIEDGVQPDFGTTEDAAENQTFWKRLARRVIRNFMGIDDTMLSIIFGESVPFDLQEQLSREMRASIPDAQDATEQSSVAVASQGSWEQRLLARVAKELGLLMHRMVEHPSAFSTYRQLQGPLPYVGQQTTPTPTTHQSASPDIEYLTSDPSISPFAPNLPSGLAQAHFPRSQNDLSLWGIEEEPDSIQEQQAPAPLSKQDAEREYWECDLDIKMVFNFLRRRFSFARSSPSPSDPQPSSPTTQPQVSSQMRQQQPTALQSAQRAQRAALIRKHHPLLAHRGHIDKTPKLNLASASTPPLLYRRPTVSSCASQSTRRSNKQGRSVRSGSRGYGGGGSSRNYWDLGGSVGSGGPVGGGSGGGVGLWGEV